MRQLFSMLVLGFAILLTACQSAPAAVHGQEVQVIGGGYQEAMVLVKGGYTPDVIVVEKGKPVRLNFVRTESASCSEMVLIPDKAGEFEFQCQMGMLRGKLIVE
ncbi:MAG: hypothetical protein ABIL11_05290 [Chloroflexota bacterium]